MSSLSFGNVLLEANGKKGVLKPMDDGSGFFGFGANANSPGRATAPQYRKRHENKE